MVATSSAPRIVSRGQTLSPLPRLLRVHHTDHVITAPPKKWRNGEEAEWLFSESKFLKPESLVELVKVSVLWAPPLSP